VLVVVNRERLHPQAEYFAYRARIMRCNSDVREAESVAMSHEFANNACLCHAVPPPGEIVDCLSLSEAQLPGASGTPSVK